MNNWVNMMLIALAVMTVFGLEMRFNLMGKTTDFVAGNGGA